MKFKELCDAVLQDPQHFDFPKVLKNHVESRDYSPYLDLEDLHEALGLALSEKNTPRLMEYCLKILDRHPFDIESHALLSQAAFRSDNKPLHHLHNFIASRLLDLLLKSGDGLSYHTAYKILHPKDEMAIFTYLRKYPKERVSHEKFGKIYDIYTLEEGKSLFFDVSIPVFHAAKETQIAEGGPAPEKSRLSKKRLNEKEKEEADDWDDSEVS